MSNFDFFPLTEYVGRETSLNRRGENVFKSRHVKSIKYDPESYILSGTVQASMKDSFREPMLDLSNNNIKGIKCTNCAKGSEPCSHKVALYISAHHNISRTDLPCRRSSPTGTSRLDKNIKIKITELYPDRKPAFKALPEAPSENKLDEFRRFGAMCGDGAAHMLWLLQPEPDLNDNFLNNAPKNENAQDPLPTVTMIEDIINSPEFSTSVDRKAYLLSVTCVNAACAHAIERATVGQGKVALWHTARRHRLTASNFGVIMRAIRLHKTKNRQPAKSTMTTLLGKSKMDGVRSIEWGKVHEADARKTFETLTGREVHDSGIHLHHSGLLGASPDGLVDEDELFEAKCPYKYRTSKNLREDITPDYIVYYSKEESQWKINTNNLYYSQIQGLLHICEKDLCWLTVWSPHDCVIIGVGEEEQWSTNLDDIIDFYFKFYLPFAFRMM